jgi:23S rRNA G2445 N2-methylase RlmL
MTHARKFAIALAAVTVVLGGTFARAADEVVVVEQSQWEKFKEGAALAGEAVVQGTKNTESKVADGAERAGDAIAEKYQDAKEYVHEKTE